uniref:Uncharacterized protein n=1 Tax=Tetranychus urticae TaxID=32264 RepID=T1L5H2_TETUR
MDFNDADDTLDATQDTATVLEKVDEECPNAVEAVVPPTLDHPYCENKSTRATSTQPSTMRNQNKAEKPRPHKMKTGSIFHIVTLTLSFQYHILIKLIYPIYHPSSHSSNPHAVLDINDLATIFRHDDDENKIKQYEHIHRVKHLSIPDPVERIISLQAENQRLRNLV